MWRPVGLFLHTGDGENIPKSLVTDRMNAKVSYDTLPVQSAGNRDAHVTAVASLSRRLSLASTLVIAQLVSQ